MDKINFINGETPINDTNLNQMQDNVENAINTITTEIEEKIPNVIDNLESTSTTEALSAKQGKILNEKIPAKINELAVTGTTIYKGSCNDITDTCVVYVSGGTDCPEELNGVNYGYLFTKCCYDTYMVQTFEDVNSNRSWKRAKINGIWSSWERQGVISEPIWLDNPLTKTNTELSNINISQAKLVIIYCTLISILYRQNVIIPVGDTEWNIIYASDGSVGYVRLGESSIVVSPNSSDTFKVLGYSLIK